MNVVFRRVHLLHRDTDKYHPDRDPDHFAPCKWSV